GYPNPDRSHFEAMDIWQSADPKRVVRTGWLGRTAVETHGSSAGIPLLYVGARDLPLALAGAPGGGAVSVNDQNSFRLEIGGGPVGQQQARRRLLEELAAPSPPPLAPAVGERGGGEGAGKAGEDDLVSFVRRRQAQTLTAVETLRELLEGPNAVTR